MQPLTAEENTLMEELSRLVGDTHIITARQLRDSGFADFVARVYRAVVPPDKVSDDSKPKD